MAQTIETQSRLAALRQRAIEGTLTKEEMKQAIIMLRADRVSAVKSSDASKRKAAKAAIPSADDMLKELGGEQ